MDFDFKINKNGAEVEHERAINHALATTVNAQCNICLVRQIVINEA